MFYLETFIKIFSYLQINELTVLFYTSNYFKEILIEYKIFKVDSITERSLLHLIKFSKIGFKKTILQRNDLITEYVIQKLCKIGDFGLLRFCHNVIKNNFRRISKLIQNINNLYLSSKNGHLNIVQYLVENHCAWSPYTVRFAAENGHLNVVQFLIENKCPYTMDSCEYAIKNGHLNILQYIHSQSKVLRNRMITYATIYDQMECFRYLHENNCPWDKNTCETAAGKGNLNILSFAIENGYYWDINTYNEAAKYGQLEILHYLKSLNDRQNDKDIPKWNEETCAAAAEFNQLKVLIYLHENKCPWDKWTFKFAAQNGNMNILRYLYENKCPWYNEQMDYQTFDEMFHLYSFLGINAFRTDGSACNSASYAGNLEALVFLRERGCVWDPFTVYYAGSLGHFDCLKYAIENGCDFDLKILVKRLDLTCKIQQYILEILQKPENSDLRFFKYKLQNDQFCILIN